MPDLTEKEIMKLKKMKDVLGEEASKKVLDNAEARERAAQAAGIEMKETDPAPKSRAKTKAAAKVEETEDEQPEALSLSELLKQLEDGLESGQIVDDVTEDETPGHAATDALEEDEQDVRLALKEIVAEVLDEKFDEFFKQMALKEKASDPQVAAIQTKLKEAETAQKTLKAQLDELLGGQPKSKPHRASQADETVVKESERPAGPAPDPVSQFIGDFILPTNGNGVTR